MLYTAAKPMPVGDRFVQVGEPVPEVASYKPHVIRRLIDTRWIFAVDNDEYDLAYEAGKDMRIGERDLRLGEPCPEVAEFEPRVLQRLIDNKYVAVTRTLRKKNTNGQSPVKGHDSRARLSA
jgi:hypothetical protein